MRILYNTSTDQAILPYSKQNYSVCGSQTVIFRFILNQFCRNFITTWRFIIFRIRDSNLKFEMTGTWCLLFSCMYSYLYSASHSQVAPEKNWITKRTKVQYICIDTCNEVRLCVLGIRKKEVGNTER
jgi:hypothetical protein